MNKQNCDWERALGGAGGAAFRGHAHRTPRPPAPCLSAGPCSPGTVALRRPSPWDVGGLA